MNNLSNAGGRKLDTSGEGRNIKVDINRTGRFIWLKLISRAL